MGVIDIAGCGVVHQVGGFSGNFLKKYFLNFIVDYFLSFIAIVASYFLGPRVGVMQQHECIVMGNAKNTIMGLFMMWWAFLAFNSGRYC